MNPNASANDKERAKDFFLSEYKYLADSFWRNEEIGETRVKFLITLVTAIIAGLVALAESTQGVDVFLIVLYSLFALMALGVVTLYRILKRNQVTDELKVAMDEIRHRFEDYLGNHDALDGYRPFPNRQVTRKFGGLAHMVAILNSLILGAIVGVILHGLSSIAFSSPWPGFLSAGVLILGTLAAVAFALREQLSFIGKVEKENKEVMPTDDFTHAGGVVFRSDDHGLRYLVTTAKKNPNHWIFPKGHIEHSEGPVKAAQREVLEETGIIARVHQLVGSISFGIDKEAVKAKFYLMEYLRETESVEGRTMRWCTYEEGRDLLSFENTRDLLKLAAIAVSNLQCDAKVESQ
jgi:8-oxo-dGTP pyrophosphatase MutT (NUDIX family)